MCPEWNGIPDPNKPKEPAVWWWSYPQSKRRYEPMEREKLLLHIAVTKQQLNRFEKAVEEMR